MKQKVKTNQSPSYHKRVSDVVGPDALARGHRPADHPLLLPTPLENPDE
jgi:hypothetical protein